MKMTKKKDAFCAFDRCEWHKGFYVDSDPKNSLYKINYSDFFDSPVEDEFPYDTADNLLCGACNCFALALKEVLGYTPYVIENKGGHGFHVFCQIHKDAKWYYVDARGVTSSFNEFMDIAQEFMNNEYIIRPVNLNDIAEWEKVDKENHVKEGYAFAIALIEKYKEYYTISDIPG